MCTASLLTPASRTVCAAPSLLADIQTRLESAGGLGSALAAISHAFADAPVSVLLENGHGVLACAARHPESAPEHPGSGTLCAPLLAGNRRLGLMLCACAASPDSAEADRLAELGKLLGFFLGLREPKAASPQAGAELALPAGIEAAARQAARYGVTATLIGEAGTGKRSLARWIHTRSPRSDAPFVALDGAHEAGALAARIAAAGNGTLYLANLDRLPPSAQACLIHQLEGATPASFRLIAALNQSPSDSVRDGRISAELGYRLSPLQIALPALRERRAELAGLIAAQLSRIDRELGTSTTLNDGTLATLLSSDWPGNLRQLTSCLEAIALGQNGATDLAETAAPPEYHGPLRRADLLRALECCGWVQAKAARMLKLTPRQIAYAVAKHGVELKRL